MSTGPRPHASFTVSIASSWAPISRWTSVMRA
jgi:hypothetical protein